MKRLIGVIVLASLIVASPAGAAPPPGIPGAWCDFAAPMNCYTYQDGDEVSSWDSVGIEEILRHDATGVYSPGVQGCSPVYNEGVVHPTSSTSCSRVRGHYRAFTFKRYHLYNSRPLLEAKKPVFIPEISSTWIPAPWIYAQVLPHPEFDKIDCNAYYSVEVGLFNAGTPQAVIDGCPGKPAPANPCGYTGPSLPEWDIDQDGRLNCEDPDYVKPPSPTTETKPETGTCPVVAVPKKGRVKVTRNGLSCFAARSTIAKYLRSGKAPGGYVCLSIRVKRVVTGKCVTISRAKGGTVVGRYVI